MLILFTYNTFLIRSWIFLFAVKGDCGHQGECCRSRKCCEGLRCSHQAMCFEDGKFLSLLPSMKGRFNIFIVNQSGLQITVYLHYDYFLGKKEGNDEIGIQRNDKHSIYCWRDEQGQETCGKNQMLYKKSL